MIYAIGKLFSEICGRDTNITEWDTFKFTLPGPPLIKKNGKQTAFNRKTKVNFIRSNDRYLMFSQVQKDALEKQKGDYPEGSFPINKNVIVAYRFKVGDKKKRDIDNLLGAPNDLLQAAGIIGNDFGVVTPLLPIREWVDKEKEETKITIYVPKNFELAPFVGEKYKNMVEESIAKEKRKEERAAKALLPKPEKKSKKKKENIDW